MCGAIIGDRETWAPPWGLRGAVELQQTFILTGRGGANEERDNVHRGGENTVSIRIPAHQE